MMKCEIKPETIKSAELDPALLAYSARQHKQATGETDESLAKYLGTDLQTL